MTIANKNDANKEAVLAALALVRQALENSPETAEVARALDQCARLELAIRQFHAEGLRFAAFTLLHLTLPPSTTFGPAVQTAARGLKGALVAAGFPH